MSGPEDLVARRPEPVERCINCRFIRPMEKTEKFGERGECHVDGPTMSESSRIARWPQVKLDDWCGRYERKAGQ